MLDCCGRRRVSIVGGRLAFPGGAGGGGYGRRVIAQAHGRLVCGCGNRRGLGRRRAVWTGILLLLKGYHPLSRPLLKIAEY